MKTLLNILTYIFLIANFANGQTMDTPLQKLIDNKLIEKKQSADIEKFLKERESKSNSAYLHYLFQIEFRKLTGHYYSEIGTSLNFGEDKPNETEQKKANQELSEYLSKLKNSDLLSKEQFSHFQEQIDSNKYFHILQLLPGIIEQVALKEEMNPEKLEVFADKLKSKEIVSSEYAKLISDIEQERLQNPIDFLNYCNKAVIINEQHYPGEPEQYLELIHKKTASIIPELVFSDFEFQIVLDSTLSDSDAKHYDFVVSLKSNGKKYKQKSYCHLYSQSKDQYFGNKIDQQEYYKIFNKILADLQSPYRLHEVKAYQGNAVEWRVFGVIALTKEQADLLHGGGVYFTPSYESFKNKLTSRRIEQAVEEYMKIGLLSHLSTYQIEQAKQKVSEQENYNLNDVLMAFHDVILTFDAELGNLEDPYAELLKEYKKISHNDFNVTEVSDNFDIEKKKKVIVKFKIGSKSYSKAFKIENDWIDNDFFDFVKSVASENKLKGQFYELYTGGQEASIIYLTKEQYDFLRANALLVFGDQWQTQEE
jgi:hypothetical protein